MSRNTLRLLRLFNVSSARIQSASQVGCLGDRFMKEVVLYNGTATLRVFARSYKATTRVGIDRDAVFKGLAMSGILQRVAKRSPLLTSRHKVDRLNRRATTPT